MKRLLLLRHGRTAWNADLRAQGQTDIPLDQLGHDQAAAAAPGVAALAPDLLWSSDLLRARETASYVARACGLDAVLDPRLREVDVGERAGLTPAEFADRFPAEHAAWAAGQEAPLVPGEETERAVVGRVTSALGDLLDALGPDGLGVAVVHGWCAKAALVSLLDLPRGSHAALRGMDNCHGALLGQTASGLRLHAYNVDFARARPDG